MSRHHAAAQQYSNMDLQSRTEKASPHQLVQMLVDGALVRTRAAIGHMERNETEQKAELIGKTINILDGLRGSLDMDKGGEISANLDDLYVYMSKQLLQANIDNQPEHLYEVCSLLEDIQAAWNSIKSTPEAATTSHAQPA